MTYLNLTNKIIVLEYSWSNVLLMWSCLNNYNAKNSTRLCVH